MTPLSKFRIQVSEFNEEINLEAKIPKDKWKILEDYLVYSTDLLDSKFVKEGMQASLNIRKEMDHDEIIFDIVLPPWDDVIVFLHKLRPIYLRGRREKTHFYNVLDILEKHFDDPRFHKLIKCYKDIYKGKFLPLMQIRSQGVVINSEKVLSYWLNSYEYHRDVDKRKFIQSLHKVFPLDASKVLFIQLLAEKVESISLVRSLVSVVIGKSLEEGE